MKMELMKRITGKAKGLSAVWKDEDESLVLFGELCGREKERDVNLLEPMYSVEFEAIPGNDHMFKLPSGKRDFLLPDGEKHDYDWLKTPPSTPLFPSLEMEANSSEMVFQKELPILQPIKPSRFSGQPETAKASTRSESPISSSPKSTTPTARPESPSEKNLIKEAPDLSNEQNSAYRIDKRSSYTALTNRRHNAVPATTTTTSTTKATKKSSDKKPVSQVSAHIAKKTSNQESSNKTPKKNPMITASKARSKDPSLGVKDLKVESSKTRRLSCPPAATIGSSKELQLDCKQNTLAATGRAKASSKSACGKSAGRAAEAVSKGRRRTGGEEQRLKLGSHEQKCVERCQYSVDMTK